MGNVHTITHIHSYPNPQNSREFYGGKQLGYMSHPKPFLSRVIFIKELQQCKIPLYNLNKNYLLWIVNELTLFIPYIIGKGYGKGVREQAISRGPEDRSPAGGTHDTHNFTNSPTLQHRNHISQTTIGKEMQYLTEALISYSMPTIYIE